MSKFTLMAALLGSCASLASAAPGAPDAPFRFAPKARSEARTPFQTPALQQQGDQKVKIARTAAPDPSLLPAADVSGYLDGPDGEIMFYTLEYDAEKIQHDFYTETFIKGFTMTVYGSDLTKLGSVTDTIELGEGETRVTQIMPGALVTKKFFNIDNNYEIMVGVACNTTDFSNTYRTRVYQLGNDKPIMTVDGYYVSAVNTARDRYSEKYWITFLTEDETETPDINGVPNVMDYHFKTYKSAGYSGMGDPALDVRVPSMTISGENAIPFLSTQKDGIPYFAVNHMKYCWYENPFDYENENPTPDNALLVDVYSLPDSWASKAELFSTTVIPSTASLEDKNFLYVGAFSYYDDISFGTYTDDVPGLIVTTQHYQSASDDYLYDYDVYEGAAKGDTAEGKYKLNIISGTHGGYFLSDVPGFDPQVMFLMSEDEAFRFDFVNLLTGELESSIDNDLGYGIYLTTSADRVAYGDSYVYVAAQTYGESDEEGNMFTKVAYIDRDGFVVRVDDLNLGKNVDLATVYVEAEALDPYVFNLDDNREYMVLLKRRNADGRSNHEELLVVGAGVAAQPLLQLGPDAELGNLSTIYLANVGTKDARMVVVYNKDYKLTSSFFPLPLVSYEKGDGSYGNPYEISTLGGLREIFRNPSAHYVVTKDFDCAGSVLSPETFEFTGSIRGNGHTIYNLCLSGRAILPEMRRPESAAEGGPEATVSDLSFISPRFEAADRQGLVAGFMLGGRISNVHVSKADFSAEGTVGGIVGEASLYAVIEECSVKGAIAGGEESSVGGIVGSTRTSASVKACSFEGSVEGGAEVGGIVGSMGNASGAVSDCHVSASIKAANTVGGVAGSSSRGVIERCHVQGSVEATAAPRWGGGPKAGGVVGEFYPLPSDSPASGPLVRNNYVNLTSLTFSGENGAEKYPGQNDTMHRIAGWTSVNGEPEEVDWDEENDRPVYGDPQLPEAGLSGNYAVASLPVCSGGIADDLASTEGKSVEASAVDAEFFEGLGFKAGYDAESPWNLNQDPSAPRLYFERAALLVSSVSVKVLEGEEFTLELSLDGEEITEDNVDGFSFESDDENEEFLILSDMRLDDGKIVIEYMAAKAGEVNLTFSFNGSQAHVNVVVDAESGVDGVVADGDGILFSNGVATASGRLITAYSAAGARLMSGSDVLDLAALPAGVYILRAEAPGLPALTLKVRK